MNKKKLILIESEMKEPKGHFLNNLIDASKFFNNKFEIYWLLNKKFNKKNTYVPKKIKKINTIVTNNFKRNENNLLYLFEEIYLFLENFLYTFLFFFYFVYEKKTFLYLNALKSNYFIIPKYFKSFYFTYKSLRLEKKDHIFFPTARRKDFALINFLSKIDLQHPIFHLRIAIPPKNNFKGVIYYLKEIGFDLKNKTAFIYVWNNNIKKAVLANLKMGEGIHETNLMFSYDPYSNFIRKPKKLNHTIGYLGHARKERGFHHLPEIIKLLEKKDNNFHYLIQFSKINKDLINTKKELFNLSKKNKRIKIIDRYLSHQEFIQMLKKIDIMPILHNYNEINNITSGTAYSCIPYQIPMVFLNKTNYMKNINKFRSFEIAKSIDDLVNQIIKISKNYKYYLQNSNLNSLHLAKIVKNDSLVKNLR